MTEPTLSPGSDIWDLDRLRLSAERIERLESRRWFPRHRPVDPFIKGPIAYQWIASACRLSAWRLQVAMACRFLCWLGPFAKPLGPGQDRRWVAELSRLGPTRNQRGRAGRSAGRRTG